MTAGLNLKKTFTPTRRYNGGSRRVSLCTDTHTVYISSDNGDSDTVLGDYIQGRLNQWAHWARAQGPRIFFLFEGPPTGCGEIIFSN